MSLTLLSPPAAEPITLSDVKAHLRVTTSDEDALINGVLVAAVRSIEARARLALMPQQWRLTLDRVPDDTVLLPLSPVASLDAVKVVDSDQIAQALDANLYEVATGAFGRLRRAGPWPLPAPKIAGVQIDFTAGYADAASVPEALKQAVKLLAAYFFETREAASQSRVYTVPQSVDALIAPFREPRL